MKNLIGGIVIGILLAGAAFGVYLMVADDGAISPEIPRQTPRGARDTVLDMICELQLDLDGQIALGINANEPSRITLAQVDFEKSSGWYQGKLSISEGRAGALEVKGSRLIVSRPAMFQRFGVTINQESFTVDRATGAFAQTVSLQDGRQITLIRGTCAKVIKPPF